MTIENPLTGEVLNTDCGTGAGGFKDDNDCAKGGDRSVPFKQSDLLRRFPHLFDNTGAVARIPDERFENARVEDVKLKNLRRFNQDDVNSKQVQEIQDAYERGDELPPIYALYYRGIYHIADGHHRATAIKRTGASQIKALVLRVQEDGSVI